MRGRTTYIPTVQYASGLSSIPTLIHPTPDIGWKHQGIWAQMISDQPLGRRQEALTSLEGSNVRSSEMFVWRTAYESLVRRGSGVKTQIRYLI